MYGGISRQGYATKSATQEASAMTTESANDIARGDVMDSYERSQQDPNSSYQLANHNLPSQISSFDRVFTLFQNLPAELRAPIWKQALAPRVIKWIRKDNQNVFVAPSKSFPLFDVCRESREVALLYGQYRDISPSEKVVYFSPIIDYLIFDPIWVGLVPRSSTTAKPDPLDSLPPDLGTVRNIMVHPNYTEERRRPTARFEKFPDLESILVAADEKSIGLHNKFMLGTVYDIKLYYEADVKKRMPDVRIPYIAVGCLGWTGGERWKMHHGSEDTRELVAVFENDAQMKARLSLVREEERRFTQQLQLGKPKLTLKFRQAKAGDEKEDKSTPFKFPVVVSNPPEYEKGTFDTKGAGEVAVGELPSYEEAERDLAAGATSSM